MKIAKARFVNPDRNFGYGLVAVSISIFVFAYSLRFGQPSILAYYALWLPLLLVDHRRALGNWSDLTWIAPFAALACLSTFWSAAPGVTARASVQFASHVVCAVIAARTVSVRTLTLGALLGILFVLAFSLAFGQYNYDPLDGSYSFVGAFPSKNQLGLFSSLGVYFAFAALVILGERGVWRLLALACGGFSAVLLAKSQSATSVITLVLVLAVQVWLRLALLFSPQVRKVSMVVGAALAITAAFVGLSLGGLDLLLAAFGKDSTLTGRTYLWSQGWAAAARTPFFGVGYQAYWVQGFSEAERLWEEFYIGSRSGFHFHNTFIEVAVELGASGVLLLLAVIVRAFAGHLGRVIGDAHNKASFVLFGLVAMFAVRAFVEVDVINPYVVGSFLLFYAAGRLAAPRTVSRHGAGGIAYSSRPGHAA
ncbi:MAG: O-antigen ligase family protein [Mesorhizobium sp.]|nr:O-antigen ligase [Mesorhizobium sp.]MBN9241948.1 O-antigen ligase family protein [Mesorhizobium sp.]